MEKARLTKIPFRSNKKANMVKRLYETAYYTKNSMNKPNLLKCKRMQSIKTYVRNGS